MPAVATNALTIATGAARSAARANNAAQAKDSDDTSFSDLLTEQAAAEKTDAPSKGNSAGQTKGRPSETKSSDAQSSGAKTPHLMAADGKSAGRKTDSVKQHQRDAKNDPTDGSDQPDVNTASNIQEKPSPISNGDVDGDAADPDQSGNNTGNQNPGNQNQSDTGQDSAGKDAAPSPGAIVPAVPDPGTLPLAPVQQANTDAMAQAAAASMPPPTVQPSAPATPSGQVIAAGSIGIGRPRPRMPDVPPQQANPSPSQTVPDADSDSNPTAIGAAAAGSAPAAAPQTLQAAAAVSPSSQNDSDPDQDDTSDIAAAPAGTTAPQPTANAQPSTLLAPPAAPASRSGAPAPHTFMAQNNKPTTPDTTSPATASAAATSKDNQPLNPDDTIPATQADAPRPPKTTEGDFKFAVTKTSDQQSVDAPARADADSNVPATSAPAPLPPQPPTPGPVSPTIALANASIGASQVPSGGSASAITNIHVGPQTADATPNVNSLAVEIAAKSQSGAKQFDIRLDPPELGRVEVRLSIDANGKAEAHMTADQPQTLHLLQKDSDTLTRALRDAGLNVSQDGLNFSLRGQDRHNGNGQNDPRGGTASRALQATKTIESMPVNSITYSSAGNARLDIHV